MLELWTAGTKAQAGDGRMTTQAAREGGPDGIVLSEEREVREKDGSTAGAAQRHRAPLRRLLSHLNHQEIHLRLLLRLPLLMLPLRQAHRELRIQL